MEPRSTDHEHAVKAERDAETRERAVAAAAAESAWLVDADRAAAAGFGEASMPGRHKPILGPRKVRAQSTVALARRSRDLKAIWIDHRLDPSFRESIMVAVASANSSRQCSFAHREWALGVGLPEAKLAALEEMDAAAFDTHQWAAIAWAHAAARNGFRHVPEAIDADFRREFTPAEQSDVELVARTMTWMNEVSNTVDAAWLRAKKGPVPESRVANEIRALILYGIAVPPLLVLIGVLERKSPIKLLRSMGPFFREFEARSLQTISDAGKAIGGP